MSVCLPSYNSGNPIYSLYLVDSNYTGGLDSSGLSEFGYYLRDGVCLYKTYNHGKMKSPHDLSMAYQDYSFAMAITGVLIAHFVFSKFFG